MQFLLVRYRCETKACNQGLIVDCILLHSFWKVVLWIIRHSPLQECRFIYLSPVALLSLLLVRQPSNKNGCYDVKEYECYKINLLVSWDNQVHFLKSTNGNKWNNCNLIYHFFSLQEENTIFSPLSTQDLKYNRKENCVSSCENRLTCYWYILTS